MDRVKKVLRFAGIFLLIVVVCYLIYQFVDNSLNGIFIDWFQKRFMKETQDFNEVTGEPFIRDQIMWGNLKIFLLNLMIFFVTVICLIIYLISRYKEQRARKRCIEEINRQIHAYLSQDIEAEQVFSSDYAEISMQLMEQKSTGRQREQMLKQEAERKNDLITYLAHDLKTPLTSVIGYLSLLDEAKDMPEQQKEKYIGITLEKAFRLEQLINEFFEITRYNLQQIGLEQERIDLYYLFVQMKDEFYPLLKEHGNQIVLNASENLMIYGDAMKLARVFNNILKNAIFYSYPNTDIHIHAFQDDENHQTVITIQNQGKTIPEGKLNRLFEKFFRLDEARSTNSGGAGLGLAIAKEIVTLHHGTICAMSNNEITTFKVGLPQIEQNSDTVHHLIDSNKKEIKTDSEVQS